MSGAEISAYERKKEPPIWWLLRFHDIPAARLECRRAFSPGASAILVTQQRWTSKPIAAECLMALVGFEVFGGVAADQPGETCQDCSEDKFDYSDHE